MGSPPQDDVAVGPQMRVPTDEGHLGGGVTPISVPIALEMPWNLVEDSTGMVALPETDEKSACR
jgi:hypothetical protein